MKEKHTYILQIPEDKVLVNRSRNITITCKYRYITYNLCMYLLSIIAESNFVVLAFFLILNHML